MNNKNEKELLNSLEPEVSTEETAPTVKTTKSGKIKSAYAAKKGAFSAALIAIFCIGLVLINLLSVVIAQKLPTTIDVTDNRSFKLSEDNINYVKQFNDIDNISNIEIILCATKAGYTGSEIVNYVYNNYGITENNSPDNYFNQTVRLIEEYPKYCSKIKVSYVDPQEPSFELLESETDIEISYGDVLVRATKKDGTIKSALLDILDLYEVQMVQDANYYYYGTESYQITISNVENAVSGALNKIAMGVNKKAALLTKSCNVDAIAPLNTNLESYDYTVEKLDGNVTYETLQGYDAVIICAPTNDFDTNTLKTLDAFLENDGKMGTALIYIASQSSPAIPNLNLFLNDWGFKTTDGILYETSSNNYYSAPTTIYQTPSEDEFALDFETTEKLFISSSNTPLEITFASKGSKVTHTLLQTMETAIIAPEGTSGNYTAPSDTVKKAYPTVVMTVDTRYDSEDNEIMSAVIGISSTDLVASTWTQYTDVGNIDFVTQMINKAVGRENSLYIMPKGTTITGIATPASAAVKSVLMWIFMIILPVVTIVGGILIWMRRIKK